MARGSAFVACGRTRRRFHRKQRRCATGHTRRRPGVRSFGILESAPPAGPMRPSKYVLRLAMLLAAITVAACGDSTAPRITDLTGVWTLKSIDGVAVDAPPPTGEATYIRVHEQLTIQAGGAYQDFVHDDYIDVASGALL